MKESVVWNAISYHLWTCKRMITQMSNFSFVQNLISMFRSRWLIGNEEYKNFARCNCMASQYEQ